jgi:hypothetical protein
MAPFGFDDQTRPCEFRGLGQGAVGSEQWAGISGARSHGKDFERASVGGGTLY